jgi:hypothetical protein
MEVVMLRYGLAVVVFTLVGTAAARADFYVVQDSSTKKCKVVETLPTEKTWVQVGPVSFKTRDEADKQITVICKEKHD